MNQLEIEASVTYDRPLPYYLSSECRQSIFGFVDGHLKIEEELRDLELFRQAVINLAREGLLLPANDQTAEPEFARVDFKAGEDLLRPTLEFHFTIESRNGVGIKIWALNHWERQGDEPQCLFVFDLDAALRLMKFLIDQKTGLWVSEVAFTGNVVDS